MAQLAAAAEGAPEPVAPTAAPAVPVAAEVPLTPIQRWFFGLGHAEPAHYNQTLLLRLRRPLAPRVLATAAVHLIARHEALRLRFEPLPAPAQGWRQRIAPPGPPPLTVLDLSRLAEAGPAIEAAAAALQGSLDLAAGPILRLALFVLGPNDPGRLLVTIHHLAVDGVSWRILLEELETACAQLEWDETVRLPSPTAPFHLWAERLAELGGSQQPPEGTARTETTSLPLDFEPTPAAWLRSAARHVETSLDETGTAALVRRGRVEDLLLAAVAAAWRRWTGSPVLLVDVEGHGREDEDLDVSRTVGWFTTITPVLLDLSAAPRRGAGSGPPAPLLFNYFGQLDSALPLDTRLAPAPESAGPHVSPRNRRSHPLQLDAAVEGGRLHLSWSYSAGLHLPETIERLARDTEEALRRCLEEPASPEPSSSSPIGADFEPPKGAPAYSPGREPRVEGTPLVPKPPEGATAAQVSQSVVPEGMWNLLSPRWGLENHDDPQTRGSRPGLYAAAPFGGSKSAPVGIDATYPLTPMQEGVLFHSRLAETSELYVVQVNCVLHGPLDLAAFRGAWQRVIDRHAVLRTAFPTVRQAKEDVGLDRPLQKVQRRVEAPLAVVDWRGIDAAEQPGRLAALLLDDRRRGFDLTRAPLLRVTLVRLAEAEHQMIFSFHHLLLDGWSTSLLYGELFHLYAALRAGMSPELPPVRPFRDYVDWLSRQDLAAAETFWRGELAGFTAPTPLPLEARPAAACSAGSEYTHRHHLLTRAETGALQRLARRGRVTLGTLVQGAWALLLARFAGTEDVVFGATFSGRPADLEGAESMLGLFISTLLVRVVVDPTRRLLPWLDELQQRLTRLRELDDCPLAEIQRWSEVPRGTPLFESLVVFENYPVDAGIAAATGDDAGGLRIGRLQALQNTSYPLTLVGAMSEEGLLLRLAFDASRHAAPPIVRALSHLAALLRAMGDIADAGDAMLDALSTLDPAERHQVLQEWSDTDRAPSPLPDPDAVARQFGGALPASDSLSLGRGLGSGRSDQLGPGDADPRPQAPASSLPAALVPLQTRGERPPLIFLHPAGGEVLCYRDLAQLLDGDRPAYGLQARGLVAGETPLTRMEEIAERAIAALLEVFPAGPYHLLGWSFGGLAVYEMACRLTAAGHDVALLAILDEGPDESALSGVPPSAVPRADDADLLATAFQSLLPVTADEIRVLPAGERLPHLFALARAAGKLRPGFNLAYAQRLLDTFQANQLAARTYRPGPYPGRVTLISAAGPPDAPETALSRRDPTLGWGGFAAAVEVHEVPGLHENLIEPPYVEALADCLRRCLSRDGG